jgi:hypothetical protein
VPQEVHSLDLRVGREDRERIPARRHHRRVVADTDHEICRATSDSFEASANPSQQTPLA